MISLPPESPVLEKAKPLIHDLHVFFKAAGDECLAGRILDLHDKIGTEEIQREDVLASALNKIPLDDALYEPTLFLMIDLYAFGDKAKNLEPSI